MKIRTFYFYCILASILCAACASPREEGGRTAGGTPARAKDAAAGKMEQPALSDVKLKGYAGEKMDLFFKNRVFSDFAKNEVFGEAEEAFRAKADDRLGCVGYWQGEFWGKLAISASGVCEYSQDGELKDFIAKKAATLISMQEPDGYLGTYKNRAFLRVNDLEASKKAVGYECNWCWNLWCRKYTLWGLLEAYKIGKNPETLAAAARFMNQYIDMLRAENVKICDTGTFVGMPSMSILKPLLILYRETSDAKFLDFAKEIVSYWDRDGNPPPNFLRNAFSGEPVRLWYPHVKKWEKAYEMMSCLEGLVDYWRVTGDEKALKAASNIRDQLLRDEKNILSSVGYNDMFVGGANQINAITEPCDAIHWMRLNKELFLASGDPKYLDEMEDTFYNAFLAGVSRDGKWGSRGVRSHGYHFVAKPQVGMKYNHCCVDNMPRGFLDFAQTALSRSGGEIFVNFYSPFKGKIGGAEVEISGGYPIADFAEVKIRAEKPTKVSFRIPSWSARTFVDGKLAKGPWYSVMADGEKTVKIGFDMSPRVVDSPLSDCYIPKNDLRASRWTGYGSDPDLLPLMRHSAGATIRRGPLLLARSKYIGNSDAEMFGSATVNNGGAECRLTPAKADKTWGLWDAEIKTADGRTIKTKVCDFASAGDDFRRGEPVNRTPTFSVFF